jgi:hypothetical protein
MGWFGKKKEDSGKFEKQNKLNEENWKKYGLTSGEEIEMRNIMNEAKRLRASNVDEDFIKDWLHSNLPEGKVKLEGKFVWICRSCETGRKFNTHTDYIAHQMSIHI